ncbi:MAG: phage protease [Panacagrimonas sp.]
MNTRPVAALCFELPASAGSELAPKTITLIPAPGPDGFVRGVDGRAWRLTAPAAVVAAFNRARAVTENHAGRLAATRGDGSPAFGWIERVRVEGGAVVGDVEWTPRGTAALNAREYRYFSPEFVWDETTSEILSLVGGSVVNDPNFTQLALNAEQIEEPAMSLLAICAALSLANTATEADCVTAINALKVDKQTALNAAQSPDPTQFAPRAELTVALNRATTAETQIGEMKKAQSEAEAVQLVDQAQAAGKVIPATRDHYLAMCRQNAESFKQLVAVMPVIAAPTSQLEKKPGVETGAEGLTPDELAICSATGVDPKAFAATKVALGNRTAA